MKAFTYRRAPWVDDALLLGAFAALVVANPDGALFDVLRVAIPLVLFWGYFTVHYPSRVTLDEDALTFSRYGREHRFARRDIQSIHVRRFLVRDRVLVRIVPSPPWRGRYWLLASLEGFHQLVTELSIGEK